MTRLLAIRLSALGDVIHTVPAVALLRGGAEVAWVVEKPYAELVEVVAGVRAIPVRLKSWSFGEIRSAFGDIQGFDAAVDFQGLIKSALIARASRASKRYGFDRLAVREKPATLFYNRHVSVDRGQHVVDWNLQVAKAVTDNRQPATETWSSFPADPNNKLAGYRGRVILLPGAGRPEKQWPVERFRDLVRRYGDQTLMAWGPGERELAEQIGGATAPDTDLRELAFLLKHARVVVGGDTGPLHLAAALGTRVVGLYGPTDPQRNGPYGQLDFCISEFDRSKSMAAIRTEDVVRRIEEVVR